MEEHVMSILKKALKISLQLGNSTFMSRKQLDLNPALKETFSNQICSLFQGFKMFMEPHLHNLSSESDKTMKIMFQFIFFLLKNFLGIVLSLCK
jgi:hypothetical protein